MVWRDRWLANLWFHTWRRGEISRIVVFVVVCVGLLGCEHLRRGKNLPDPTPRTQLLAGEGETVPVVMSQLGAPAHRIVTAAAKIPVELHFDPSMIDMERAEKYSLWTRSGPAAWQRLVEVSPAGGAIIRQFDAGAAFFLPPVIANQTLYTLDSKGKITAWR